MSVIMTKAALALKNAESNFKFVKFKAHKPKMKNVTKEDENIKIAKELDSSRRKDLELKKIRHEVLKFGMSGFDSTKKEEAKIALAVSLGAKPPRKDYINYKDLMKKRKEEKLKAKEAQDSMAAKSVLKTAGKKKKKGLNNDVGHFLSSYGKIQKKDLKKDDSKKKKMK